LYSCPLYVLAAHYFHQSIRSSSPSSKPIFWLCSSLLSEQELYTHFPRAPEDIYSRFLLHKHPFQFVVVFFVVNVPLTEERRFWHDHKLDKESESIQSPFFSTFIIKWGRRVIRSFNRIFPIPLLLSASTNGREGHSISSTLKLAVLSIFASEF